MPEVFQEIVLEALRRYKRSELLDIRCDLDMHPNNAFEQIFVDCNAAYHKSLRGLAADPVCPKAERAIHDDSP